MSSITETLSTQYPVFVTDCVNVTGVANFPYANGLYHYNASIEECRDAKSGHPTYKHATEEVYLWYAQHWRHWIGSDTNCDAAMDVRLFMVHSTAAYSPGGSR